jgi:hypothetical protein
MEEDAMNPKKQKIKNRRRARKLADEAWEAVDAGNFDLAEKIIRRAVDAQTDNPVLWNDQGLILGMRQKEMESAEAFRVAIHLAPTYAEAFANFAALRFRQGFAKEATGLQAEAVKHAPENLGYAERLAAYRAVAGQPAETRTAAPVVSPPDEPMSDWPRRPSELDWRGLGERLTRDGCVVIPQLLDPATCADVRGMFDHDALFAKTIVMDRPEFGLGVYRYFRAPIPKVVDQLRRAVYPHVARVANDWRQLLNEPHRFPDEWAGFRDECQRAGQTTPTPILLKYEPGGFNAPHRDLRGSVFFPIQMAVVLSPCADPPEGFRGGTFLLCDVPSGKKLRRREIAAGLGDGILFCTRDRLVTVGGAYGLLPVKHGVAPITAGLRYVLGVPFHEYR